MTANGWAQVDNAWILSPDLTASEFRVLAALSSYDWMDGTSRKGIVWPSVATLADCLGVHWTTVWRAIKGLERKGFIRQDQARRNGENGKREHNIYHLCRLASEGWTQLPSAWIFNPDLTAIEFRILAALASYDWAKDGERNGIVWPSIASIASRLRVHRTTIWRALKGLEQKGFLQASEQMRRDNGRWGSNVYYLLTDVAVSGILPAAVPVQP